MSHFRSKLLSLQCVDWTGRGSGVQNTAPTLMVGSMPPITVVSHFGVKGGQLTREAKVPLKTITVGDVKHNVVQIRKRDYWMHGGFVPKKV